MQIEAHSSTAGKESQFSLLDRIRIDKNVFVYRQELFWSAVSFYNLQSYKVASIEPKSDNLAEFTLDTEQFYTKTQCCGFFLPLTILFPEGHHIISDCLLSTERSPNSLGRHSHFNFSLFSLFSVIQSSTLKSYFMQPQLTAYSQILLILQVSDKLPLPPEPMLYFIYLKQELLYLP